MAKTAFGRFWSRGVPLAVAGAVGWLTAASHYGFTPESIAPLLAAHAAPPATATPPPAPGYRIAVARATASVVSVYGAGEISRGGLRPDVRTLSIGSGVILDRSGYVVTSGRLFQGTERLIVALGDGTPFAATFVGLDEGSNIALLKIEAAELKPIEMGDMADVAVGDIVLAIGNPPGIGQTVSQGIIGAIGRSRSGIDGYIETDAAIAPGGYGGALVDTAGRLVGITAGSVAIGNESPGIRVAVPVDRVKEVVARLKKKGRDA
jgi:S1-C subfamily serine protease